MKPSTLLARFTHWLEANPVYRAERKRVSRRLKRVETSLALMGLAYTLLVGAAVAVAAYEWNVPMPLPVSHAIAQGWSVVYLIFGQPFVKALTVVGGAWLLLFGGLLLGLEGGLIGVACAWKHNKPRQALLAATAWTTLVAFVPLLYSLALSARWSYLPQWTGFLLPAAVHAASAFIAYMIAVRAIAD